MPLTYKLLGSTELTTNVSELVFSSIPQGFDHLIISGISKVSSGTPLIRMKINGSSSNYIQRIVSGTSVSTATTNSYMEIAGAGTASEFYPFSTTIFDYSSGFYKNVFSTWAGATTSGTSSNQWESVDAITSLTIYLQDISFVSGTRINVYGVAGLDKGNNIGAGGSFARFQVTGQTLTTSGTWTLPSGVTSVDVVAVGGGANGGNGGGPTSTNPKPGSPGGSGGRGGSIAFSTVNVSAPVSYTIGGAGGTTTFSAPVAVTAPGAEGAPAGGGGGQGSPGGPGTAASQNNLGIGGVNITIGGGGGGGGGAGNGAGQNAGGGGAGGTGAGPGGGGGGKKAAGGPGVGANVNALGSGGGGGGGAGGWNQYGSSQGGGGAGGAGRGGQIILYYKVPVT